MKIEFDNHQIITTVLAGAILALGGYTYHKIQQIDKIQQEVIFLQREVKHIKTKTPQIEKNKDGLTDLKIEITPMEKEFYNDKEQAK